MRFASNIEVDRLNLLQKTHIHHRGVVLKGRQGTEIVEESTPNLPIMSLSIILVKKRDRLISRPEPFARRAMYPKFSSGGEGESTPAFRPSAMMVPGFVVWPMASPPGANALDGSQELYRLAYEWAAAVLRPGPYELACRIVAN
jgi:hypothetical protein